jgi:cell fate regulator YaaT (PSP1 superfamily)
MALVVGIKFDPDSFPKYYRPSDFPLEENDFCVVPHEGKGPAERVGYVTCFEGRCTGQAERLAPITRLAKEEEIDQWHLLCRRRREALATARAKVVDHALPMKIISVQFDDEQNIVLFNFTADHRIDFRELVRELAGIFKARIELWQIGSRQGAAEKDGFGHCGMRLCCVSWLKNFPPISIRHARDQDINQPPPKLSGQCGRLRCCLRYEHETYCRLRHDAPPLGAAVRDNLEREGQVIDRNLLTEMALIKFEEAEMEWLAVNRLTWTRGADEAQPALAPVAEEDEPVAEEDNGMD